MTMNDHDDIEPDDGRDPGRMGADERRAELACILARGLRGAIIEHRADGSLSREIQAVSAPACLDLSPDLRLTVCHAADGPAAHDRPAHAEARQPWPTRGPAGAPPPAGLDDRVGTMLRGPH
jgi:hypothetical protein